MRASFPQFLHRLKVSGQYREFEQLRRVVGAAPVAQRVSPAGPVISWCSNDYLNLSQHDAVVTAAVNAAVEHGVGSGGTRNLGGTTVSIVALETELAAFHDRPAALLFPSAYAANTGTLAALAAVVPNLQFMSDADNHASMIEGMRSTRRPVHVFAHNDMDHLTCLLDTIHGPTCICTESIFSMDGSVAPLRELAAVADRTGALLYVDEVHAVGLYSDGGRGLCDAHQVTPDILIGGCGKALGTQGGYVVGASAVVDCVRSVAPSFIFTTSPSTVVVEATRAALGAVVHPGRRRQFFRVVDQLKTALRTQGVPFHEHGTHIVAVPIGSAHRCKAVATRLFAQGHYAQPIFYPTVPKDQARLRLTPTPFHTPAMIHSLTASLVTALSDLPAAT